MQKFTYVLSNKRPPSLLTFKLFVGPQLPSYDPQYLSPSKLTAYFFPEYLSNESYSFIYFLREIRIRKILNPDSNVISNQSYRYYSNRVPILVEV